MSYSHQPVFLSEREAGEAVTELANRLDIKIVQHYPEANQLYLTYHNNHLCLCKNTGKDVMRISVDFVSSSLLYRQQNISLKTEPLLRAIGCKPSKLLHILDATAGLGRDAFLLANYHCKLTMLEASPIVFALLSDGLERAKNEVSLQEIISHMVVKQSNSIDYLQKHAQKFDVVYLDPMFPVRNKSAKVKKEMQLLHQLLGASESQSDEQLLNLAREHAVNRVVVKRPKTADYLAQKKPSYSINTKAMRYDVYVRESMLKSSSE